MGYGRGLGSVVRRWLANQSEDGLGEASQVDVSHCGLVTDSVGPDVTLKPDEVQCNFASDGG